MLQFSHPDTDNIAELVALWNLSFGADWPLTQQLLRQTMQHDPYYEREGCFIARDGDRIVGWVLSKTMKNAGPEVGRFQGRGGIGALCVHPDYRRQGIASQLLDRAESHLTSNGIAPCTLYYPHHLLPGIPVECEAAISLFQKRGYGDWKECVDLKRDLCNYQIPEKAREAIENNPTVELRPARVDEADAVIQFVEREFPGGWPYGTRGHFARGGAAGDFVIAVEHGEVIGFCHTADWRSGWLLPSTYWHLLLGENFGGLGPIGMAREHRKRGLGLALCAVAVETLQNKGVISMAIDWTTLTAFYEQLGFSVWKRYLQATRAV